MFTNWCLPARFRNANHDQSQSHLAIQVSYGAVVDQNLPFYVFHFGCSRSLGCFRRWWLYEISRWESFLYYLFIRCLAYIKRKLVLAYMHVIRIYNAGVQSWNFGSVGDTFLSRLSFHLLLLGLSSTLTRMLQWKVAWAKEKAIFIIFLFSFPWPWHIQFQRGVRRENQRTSKEKIIAWKRIWMMGISSFFFVVWEDLAVVFVRGTFSSLWITCLKRNIGFHVNN